MIGLFKQCAVVDTDSRHFPNDSGMMLLDAEKLRA